MSLSLVVAVPTFVCSLLSLLASTAFAVCYFLFPPERHFRQALIVNLLVSDFINSLNNSISGAAALYRRNDKVGLGPGPACTANGYIGQLSVQATDFNILVISLSVLATVRRSQFAIEPPWWQVAVVCAIPWIPGLITSNVALALDAYHPVSGDWCWLKKDIVMRYALTHGWRMAIFVATIAIYTYIYIYLKRVYGRLNMSTGPGSGASNECTFDSTTTYIQDPESINVTAVITVRRESDMTALRSLASAPSHPSEEVENGHAMSTPELGTTYSQSSKQPTTTVSIVTKPKKMSSRERTREKALRKMLLLNGYPLLYILLWIPGMANRIVEIVGKQSPVWLTALAASTQLVGFANALTYAWNESLLQRAKSRWQYTRRRGRTVSVLPSARRSALM